MASTIQFSQEELRGIRTQCEALLGVMNSRAQEIVRLSEEIEKEINNSVLSSHCPPQENHLVTFCFYNFVKSIIFLTFFCY